MSLEFIKLINEYVIESLLEASDDEILGKIGSSNYPSRKDITAGSQLIHKAIQEDKRKRLEQKKAEFSAFKARQKSTFDELLRHPVATMVADIAKAMQNSEDIPEGILVAFREQQAEASDEDIAQIWQNLVELGLIDPNHKD